MNLRTSHRFTNGLLLLGLLLAGGWMLTPIAERIEQRYGLESLFRWRGSIPAPAQVVVIGINRDSFKALDAPNKLYQWSRHHYAQLVHLLDRHGAQLIVFDMFFEDTRDAAGDQQFAAAMRDAGNVLLFARSETESIATADSSTATPSNTATLQTLTPPHTLFREQALGTAPLILPKIPARVSRFFTRHPNLQQSTLPSLAWLLQQPEPGLARYQLTQLPDALPLNLYGPPRTITTIDFHALLQQPEQYADIIRRATVFVGYSAREQPDQRDGFYTAFTAESGLDIAGVELAATAFANLRDQTWVRTIHPLLAAMLTLLLVAVSYCISRLLPAQWALPAAFILPMTWVAFCLGTLTHYNLWLPWLNFCVMLAPLSTLVGMNQRHRQIERQRLGLMRTFQKYLPHDELERTLSNGQLPPRRHHHAICFVSDAAGFSKVAESCDADTMASIMQRYYEMIIPPIRAAGGIISDVAGDGIIALWPQLSRKHAWTTLRPALEQIHLNIAQFNREFSDTPLPTRIGIHAGEVSLGHFGAADHHEFRAIGDIINSTSRLEGANKQLGTRLLISECCLAQTSADLRDLGKFDFLGKEQPLRLFCPVNGTPKALLQGYQNALSQFEAGQIETAKEAFMHLHEKFKNDRPTAHMVAFLNDRRNQNRRESCLQRGVIMLSTK